MVWPAPIAVFLYTLSSKVACLTVARLVLCPAAHDCGNAARARDRRSQIRGRVRRRAREVTTPMVAIDANRFYSNTGFQWTGIASSTEGRLSLFYLRSS